jgi:hypothetical protein
MGKKYGRKEIKVQKGFIRNGVRSEDMKEIIPY